MELSEFKKTDQIGFERILDCTSRNLLSKRENAGTLIENALHSTVGNANFPQEIWDEIDATNGKIFKEKGGVIKILQDEELKHFYDPDRLFVEIPVQGTDKRGIATSAEEWEIVPFPLIHLNFEKEGTLDEIRSRASNSAERVLDRLNSLLAVGGFKHFGNEIHGVTTHPNRMKQSITAPAWNGTRNDINENKKNGDLIVCEFLEMYRKMIEMLGAKGNYFLGVPKTVRSQLENNYPNSDFSIKDRIEKTNDGSISVIEFKQLPDNNIVLLNATHDFFQLAIGEELQTTLLKKKSEGQMNSQNGNNTTDLTFCTFAIQVPVIKKIRTEMGVNGYSTGIVHGF